MRLLPTLITILTWLAGSSEAVRCLDCVGKDCMGAFCEGDYCVMSQYAPRWGTVEWGTPQIVKGCMNGTLLRKDIRDHCEVVNENDDTAFTCFCNGRDNCNGGRTLRKLEREEVELVTCVCKGAHCRGQSTCIGEMCSYVVNHRTKEIEQGCVNATIPLIERRSVGACMIPPITGAMHHTVAKDAAALLATESCVCGQDYCNSEKPKPNVPEREKCTAFVRATILGTKMTSRNITCTGEFCFKASIKTSLGSMSEYSTIGCASFTGEDQLPEELNPTGCATFNSEQLEVKACFKTSDQAAIKRARANQQVVEPKTREKSRGKPKPTMAIEFEDDEEEQEEEEEEEAPRKESKATEKTEKEEEDDDEEEEVAKPAATTEAPTFIFQNPTQPPIPDDSNTTMITVFILIMLCIVVSGAVWKLELHKKLFRANYDTVAGG